MLHHPRTNADWVVLLPTSDTSAQYTTKALATRSPLACHPLSAVAVVVAYFELNSEEELFRKSVDVRSCVLPQKRVSGKRSPGGGYWIVVCLVLILVPTPITKVFSYISFCAFTFTFTDTS